MDPLSALGLAAGVVQFVQFAGTLLSMVASIQRSPDGTHERARDLESIYGRLGQFSARLRPRQHQDSGGDARAHHPQAAGSDADVRALQDLAAECHDLCRQLLDLVGRQRVQPGSEYKTPRTFRAVLKAVWEKKRIADLETRLNRVQKGLSMHFYPVLSRQQDFLLRRVDTLKQESCDLKADQANALRDATLHLRQLKQSNHRILQKLEQHGIRGLTASTSSKIAAFMSCDPTDSGTAPPTKARRADASGITMDEALRLEEGIAGLSLARDNLATIAREQAFLRSLNFPSRRLRHDDIPIAHKNTFLWMLGEPRPEQPQLDGKGVSWAPGDSAFTSEESASDDVQAEEEEEDDDRGVAHFPAWLREGDGIFWVSGKAGAGKSTLMKLVADHPDTRRMLEQWAGPKKLSIAAHYVWSAGTAMQSSQTGLLRSLLYEIFRGCPADIPVICPERWQQTLTDPSSGAGGLEWTVSELSATLGAVAEARDLGARYCIFIDGADEFKGDHFDLCRALSKLSASPNLKLCISSRPWSVFENAFGAHPGRKLYLHKLNRSDILAYSQDRLADHPRWSSDGFEKAGTTSLVNHIADRAQGVFLWAFMVTRSLRDGMTSGDTIADLQRRLFSLPTDLERLFRSMLDTVDPFYVDRMAQTLTIAAKARQPLHYLHFCMHEHTCEDKDYVLNRAGHEAQALDLDMLRDQCQRRLNARYGGLLEVKGATVEFLHRAVRDFLLTSEMSDYLASKCGGHFLVNVSTLSTHVALIRRGARDMVGRLDRTNLYAGCLAYAADALDESHPKAMALFDVLDDYRISMGFVRKIQSAMFGRETDWSQTEVLEEGAILHPRALFLLAGVESYVAAKLHESPAYFDRHFYPPLLVIMEAREWSDRHCRIVGMLLDAGHNPNQRSRFSRRSSWEHFLYRACDDTLGNDNRGFFRLALDSSLFSLFIKHGAEKHLILQHNRCHHVISSRENTLERTEMEIRLTPAAFFLRRLFSYDDAYLSAQPAMAALRDFLSCRQGDEGMRALVVTLRVGLEGRLAAGDAKPRSAKRLKFYADVTCAVTEAGLRQGADLSALLPAIQSALIPAMQAVLHPLLGDPLAQTVPDRPSSGDRDTSCDSAADGKRPSDAERGGAGLSRAAPEEGRVGWRGARRRAAHVCAAVLCMPVDARHTVRG